MAIFKASPSRWILQLFFLHFSPHNAVAQPETGDGYGSVSRKQAAVMMAVTAFIFATFYFVTCWFRRCRGHGFVPQMTTDVEGDGVMHAVARGLDAETIESFPSFRYVEVKGLKLGNGELECAVCLSEFEDDETLRLMSPCSHVFHARCVDPWLFSRPTCPICRVHVVPEPGEIFPCPVAESNTNLGTAPDADLESSGRILIDGVTSKNNKNKLLRSRSHELYAWLANRTLFTRSRSFGHLMVQSDEKLDRFTLQLPKDVRVRLMKTHTTKWTRTHTTISDEAQNKTKVFASEGQNNR